MKQHTVVSSQARSQQRLTATQPASIPEAPHPKTTQRANVTPTDGFTVVVDGCLKGNYDDEAAAKKAAADLLSRFPKLHVEIFNASTKTRSKV
jgi:hypothetical protein